MARIGENIITDEQERAARLLEARTRRRRPQRLPVRSRSRVASSIKSNYVIAHPFIHLINGELIVHGSWVHCRLDYDLSVYSKTCRLILLLQLITMADQIMLGIEPSSGGGQSGALKAALMNPFILQNIPISQILRLVMILFSLCKITEATSFFMCLEKL